MSTFAEFFLIAFAIYLWESGLWLPPRTVALRQAFLGRGWKALAPGRWIATKDLGLVPMLPLIADEGLAPCQSPPLLADENGGLLLERSEGEFEHRDIRGWEHIHADPPRLKAGGLTLRISSPRCLEPLRSAKRRGLSPAAGATAMWNSALSPGRARREWRRWRSASALLRWLSPLLTLGFFGGLPAMFITRGVLPTLLLALALWVVMVVIAARVWCLGRLYPSAKAAFRMDAMLSLLVPFHAMRAAEIGSVHAMAMTHPFALLAAHGDLDNPWLASFARRLLFPRPDAPGDIVFSRAVRPRVESALHRRSRKLEDYVTVPDRADDPDATRYCPRCHALYQQTTEACADCGGLPLRPF